MSDDKKLPEPVPCGGGCKGNDERPVMVEAAPTTIDQSDRGVRPMPGFVWRCLCGWARELPAKMLFGSAA